MDQRILAVRVGDKYGPEYEDYLRSKIPNIEFLNTDVNPFVRQWNKLSFMELNTDEPICVIDIDIIFENDYMDMFNYPIAPGEFVCMKSWWRDTYKSNYCMNGGFYKFYPKDVKPIADKFKSNPEWWMNFYWKNGTTHEGMGEQYFVEDSVKELGLTFKYLPQEWYTKWKNNPTEDWVAGANVAYPGDWLYLGEFNPNIKLIHYQADFSL